MSASKLDAVYRSILLTKFFTKGWGKPENLRRLFEFRKIVSNRDECFKLVDKDYPVTITKFFWRRRNLMVKPLIKEAGIGGIILENPFYGLRKPTDQIRSSLHNVSDIFVMGGCLILESLVLFHWCERNGLGPLGVTGLSMGGHMASLAATNWPKPLVLVPCLSWSTASAVFLQGVMSQSINWDLLEDQYLSDGAYREKLSKMVTIVDEAFLAGKKFARTYSQNMESSPNPSTDTKPQNAIIDSLNRNTLKKVDITYKEDVSDKHSEVTEDSNKDIAIKPNVPFNTKWMSNKDEEKFKENLKEMLENNKITEVLYNKLTSNKNFELEPQDIENINKLTDGRIKLLLLKYKDLEMEATPQQRNETNKVESKNRNENLSDNHKELFDDTSNKIVKQKTSDNEIKTTESTELTIATDKKDKKPWTVSDFTSDLWVNLPFFKPSGKKIDIGKIHWRDREALQFMRGIMDECTHLSNFSIPFDTSLIIAVCAKHDAYVPRDDVGTLEEIWPGAEVRYVDAGHVSAYILHQSLFRSCIMEAFERSKKKWSDGKHL
ncbi:protein ABHD18 isoform X2 [Nymphalis io]|uniref:protein ABHD18 isoform X2 n=1 Tax=Inachis io TaxID=171585 RepID=UPI002166E753|nr:protein ABHD18 isoform X2 [Nymphalis io]